MIELLERGALEQVGIGAGRALRSPTSPATPSRSARSARSPRPPTGSAPGRSTWSPRRRVCEHCAGGCATRTDHRRGKVMRRMAANDPEVNEEWLCDKGRFGFRYAQRPDRLTHPLVRDADGELRRRQLAGGAGRRRGRDWPPRAAGPAVLAGGRLTVEDAYAYAKFARVVLGTNDVDFRARAAQPPRRPTSWPPRSPAAASTSDGTRASPTPRWRRRRPSCWPDSRPRRRPPGVFLRLRKAHRKFKQQAYAAGHPRHPRSGQGGRHPAARRARHRAGVAGRAGRRRRPGRGRPAGRRGAARRRARSSWSANGSPGCPAR